MTHCWCAGMWDAKYSGGTMCCWCGTRRVVFDPARVDGHGPHAPARQMRDVSDEDCPERPLERPAGTQS